MTAFRLAVLSTGAALALSGCTHMSQSQKRVASYVTGMVVGGAVGTLATDAAKSDSANKSATTLGYALAGSAAGFAVGEIFFSDGEKLAQKDSELEVYRSFTKNMGKQQAVESMIYDEVRLRDIPASRMDQGNPFASCRNDPGFLRFCASPDGPNQLGNCREPALLYLNEKWAIEFRAWYSDSGCFAGSNYSVVPGLLEWLNPIIFKMNAEMK